ncbi:putative ABC transport system permease protein [Clostridium cavendishii DSM 21758]|uniref:Putative ABC transport system permease protein n=2 Tax=Clostridium TaxID=1485 RepID=A0A1M6MK92_9CLOT|nr:putative ABC transport system permease protein [Clostridium cavendishii DSM 21758]
MLLSVILSTTLLFVSLTMGDSYKVAQRKMEKGYSGVATVSVTATKNENEQLKFIKEDVVKNLDKIKSKVGIIKSTALYSENGYFENFDMLAADLDGLNTINKPRLIDNEDLSNFSGYKIILPEKFTTKYKIKKGDNIKLTINQKPINFEVYGIAAYDTVFLRSTRGFNALIPKETLRDILNIKDEYTEILLEPKKNIDTNTLITEVSKTLSQDKYKVNAVVDEKQIEQDAKQKTMPFFLISFFSLTMSIFIIYSSYKVITIERLRVIGTFRSIGATKKAVTKILMLESLVYGVLGGAIGIPLGMITLKFMLRGMTQNLTQGVEIPMVITATSLIVTFFVAIIMSNLSAYIPVKKSSEIPVKDIVLGTVEKKHVSNKFKILMGAILFFISILLPNILKGNMLLIGGGLSLITLIVATIILIPIVTNGISLVLEKVYGVILGNEGKLSARNMRDNKNITQNITLLFISISAVIVITVVGSFVSTYIGDVFKGSKLDGFTEAKNIDKTFVDKLSCSDNVKSVVPLYVINGTMTLNGCGTNRVEGVKSLEEYNDMFALKYEDSEEKNNAIKKFNDGRNILLNYEFIKMLKVKVGEKIQVAIGNSEYEYEVLGSYKSRANNSQAVLPSKYLESDFGQNTYGMIVYRSKDSEGTMAKIRSMHGSKENYSRTVEEFTKDSLEVVTAFLKPLNSLNYCILLLSTIGIINNLLINYIQKQREIAMYRAVGLSTKQNVKMTLIEAFTSGIIGSGAGMIISYLEIRTIFIVAGPRISMSPDFQLSTFLIAGFIGIALTLVGSIVPIIKNNKMKIVEKIKTD